MAAPKLVIRPWAYASSFNSSGVLDLSALTSPTGAYNPLTGDDGTDFYVLRSWGSSTGNASCPLSAIYTNQKALKATGTAQLEPVPFGPEGPLYYQSQIEFLDAHWASGDANNMGSGGTGIGNYGATLYIPDGVVDTGIRVPNIVAKRGELRSAYFLWRVNSGTYVASASIADGSSPNVSLPPVVAPRDTYTELGFAVDYTPGPNVESTGVTVELRLATTGATYQRFICPHVSYITPALKLRRSRGYREHLRSHGALGGVYA